MANHLVIGLGGTGGSVLRSLRKRIYEEFRSNDPKKGANIEYLYVDSSLADLNNEEDWQTLGVSVQLSPAQRLSINGIGASVLSNLDQYPGINSFINKKDEAKLSEGIGAIIGEGIGGQRRRFGRMLIANNMCGLTQNTFIGQVHARVKVLKDKENVDDVTFHICAGLGGGTGSGSIVDAITQIRNEFQRSGDDNPKKFKILLYLYIPEKIIQIPGGEASNRYYQPNGYAALQELNAMSVGCYYPTDVKGTTDEYGQVNRLLKGQDAFDMAYLYTNVNESGKEVNLHKVLPNIVGDFLFQKIVSSDMNERGRMARLESNENYGLLPESNESQEPVHSRKFMTFGVKRIEYPETEIVEYGAYNFARQSSMQMLYGLWDETRGYIECTEDMIGKNYPLLVNDASELESNLLSDDYLTLSKPLPSLEKLTTNWKPIVQGWEFYTDRYKQDVQAECPKKEWYEEFNGLCNKFFDSMYRGVGVKKFYFDNESQLSGYAEEIVRRIENNLFNNWKNGTMSILEVHKYINSLITKSNERIEDYKAKITKRTSYLNEDLANQLENIRRDWNNIGWLRDAITNASTKTFGRFVDAKREQLTLETTVIAYNFAVKLLSEVANYLTQLNVNCIEALIKLLSDFASNMNKLAEDKCKLSDIDTADIRNEVVKEYNPKLVRDTVYSFLKMKETQKRYSDSLRASIIEAVGTINNGFSDLAKKINLSSLQKITLKACIENARKEMEDYSMKHANQRLVNVNILDKLRNSNCSTEYKRKQFIKEIYDAAQSFLTFNASEEGKGSSETAANHNKIIQISLPMYEEDAAFRDEFIKDFGESGKTPFDKDHDVSTNFKSNQIVVVTAHSGFPLRYVDNVRVLKEKYDILTRNDVNRMVIHTESFAKELPSLFNKSREGQEKDLMPILLLAYAIGTIIVERENSETGEKEYAFAEKDDRMGRTSRWIRIGENILETLEDLSKQSRAMDVVALKKAVQEELNTNYKHIEKKKALMMKMGKVLDDELLPLFNNNDRDLKFMAFNAAAEKLCDNNLVLD